MTTLREAILVALHTLLHKLPAAALRGEMLHERMPDSGLLILRDGESVREALQGPADQSGVDKLQTPGDLLF